MKSLFFILSITIFATSGYSQEAPIGTIETLISYFDKKPKKKNIADIEASMNSEDPLEQALATGILFKYFSKKYESDMIRVFAVHDYIQRRDSTLVFYNEDEIQQVNEEIISQLFKREGIEKLNNKWLVVLHTFLAYKDMNIWVKNENSSIDLSLARIFRGMYLEWLLHDTKTDSFEFANLIDQQTRQLDLKK